jgi:two-component system, cell cycle sensor histidine kinase and response regulator CckA
VREDRSSASLRQPWTPLGWFLSLGVVAADLFVVGLIAMSLQHSLEERKSSAAVDVGNLARLLEQGLSATFDRINLTLLTVAEDHARMAKAGTIDRPAFQALLIRQLGRTPDLLTLRTTDAEGVTEFNVPELGERVSLGNQEFFATLRDNRRAGLHLSHPYAGRIVSTPVMIASRRVTTEDGQFAGVVTGSIELDHLSRVLDAVDVGPRGALSIRFDDLSLVARRGPRVVEVSFGDRRVPRELSQRIAAGSDAGGFEATSSLDGLRRTYAFRRLPHYPIVVVAALSQDDYLDGWWRLLAMAIATGAIFIVATFLGAWYGLATWRRRLEHERLLQERTERLRESEERFRTAFETSPDSVNLNRVADGVYVAINEGFSRMTGYTEAEVMGRSSLELDIWVDPADRTRLVQALQERGFVENLEARFRRKDGSTLVGLMSARLIQLKGDSLHLSITRDVTEWKRAEGERDRLQAQVQQTQRLEGLGRLAGGVAHDFNNLLTVILSCCEVLREELGPRAPVLLADVAQIQAAGERARDLTRQLLAIARKQVVAPVVLDLASGLRRAERLLGRVLGEDVALVVEAEEGLWPVLCDPGQLEQVVMNLAVNARDAMPDGGTLTISARNASPVGPEGEGQPRWVRLSVRDTGSGMTPEVQAHLFEPFFTTKEKGKGTGLGLAMVHGIVAQGGGRIEVRSEVGQGSSFEILLPGTAERACPAADPTPVAPVGGNETVLVIEDDELVRGITVRALKGGGYRVLVAASGPEALALVKQGAERIDLVVTDVIMPGPSGPEVVEALRRLRPGLRVLYVSGYPADAMARRGVGELGKTFLTKPFTAASLLERVRAVVDA